MFHVGNSKEYHFSSDGRLEHQPADLSVHITPATGYASSASPEAFYYDKEMEPAANSNTANTEKYMTISIKDDQQQKCTVADATAFWLGGYTSSGISLSTLDVQAKDSHLGQRVADGATGEVSTDMDYGCKSLFISNDQGASDDCNSDAGIDSGDTGGSEAVDGTESSDLFNESDEDSHARENRFGLDYGGSGRVRLEEEEEEEDFLNELHIEPIAGEYCVNCTAMLYDGICDHCGHRSENNDLLLGFPSTASTEARRSSMCVPPATRRTVLAYDERMLQHQEGNRCPHPERPDRLRAIMARLTASDVSSQCLTIPVRPATDAEILTVHDPEYLAFLNSLPSRIDGTSWYARGRPRRLQWMSHITADTFVNQFTADTARLAAGAAVDVAVAVTRGVASSGAAIVRPPGHHAESGMAMGFCFLNNAAIAARAAQAAGAKRVLILDWDIHHGNGTQHIFENDPSVMYMSLHRHDGGTFYPCTGDVHSVGSGAGKGYTVNVAWDGPGVVDADYLLAFRVLLLPIARSFAPDIIIVSAGFDASEGDPIGGCLLTPSAFGAMTAALEEIAPLALLLEGGYNLIATAASAEACMRVLLSDEQPEPPAPMYLQSTLTGRRGVAEALSEQSSYWPCLLDPSSACECPWSSWEGWNVVETSPRSSSPHSPSVSNHSPSISNHAPQAVTQAAIKDLKLQSPKTYPKYDRRQSEIKQPLAPKLIPMLKRKRSTALVLSIRKKAASSLLWSKQRAASKVLQRTG